MQMNTTPFQIPVSSNLRWLAHAGECMLGLSTLDTYYRERQDDMSPREFLRYTLDRLGIDYRVASGSTNEIPEKGPAIVIANHPFGAIEGVMLSELLLQRRDDVKVLANEYLHRISELSELFIGVDVFETSTSTQSNINGIKQVVRHLKNDGLLLIFPAGEVSSIQLKQRQITDKKWNRIIAMLVRKTGASTIPIYIDGKNSHIFYLAGLMNSRFRTAMLVREMLNKREQVINLHIGQVIPFSELKSLKSDEAITDYLRLNTYLLNCQADNNADIAKHKNSLMQNIALPIEKSDLQEDIDGLDKETLLLTNSELSVFCASAEKLPHILQEIGRLREITFRQVAEGTGLASDIDEYDEYYLHMFIWNNKKQEVVGAYRLGLLDQIMERNGIKALYTRSLFKYDERFVENMGVSIELGRSFIRLEYQRSLSALFMLWKGIAAFASRNPKYTTLFGPVSISSGYSELSRNLMQEFLELHHYDHERAKMVKAQHTQKKTGNAFWTKKMLEPLSDNQLISKLVYRMEGDKGLPVLLKQYLGLNGKLVSFNLDKSFNDALDGMIIVDLLQTSERTLGKYMGKDNAKKYLQR